MRAGAGHGGARRYFRSRGLWIALALGSAVAVLGSAVAAATVGVDLGGSPSGSGDGPALRHEKLACTDLEEPANFEVFSSGAAVEGLPLTAVSRRCDRPAPGQRWPANYVAYTYGSCEIPEGEGGCMAPLEIQSWPACQRSLADYSFGGRPLPHRSLAKHDAAEVVEFDFRLERRIEVYSKEATVVIFADEPALARRAVASLNSQGRGKPPVTAAGALRQEPADWLAPPSEGSTEGVLPC